jgi:peptide/nickel transport system permease protein
MSVFLLRRLLLALLVAAFLSVIVFVLLRLSGDIAAVIAGPGATFEDIAAVRSAFGLDRPLLVQYVEWALAALRGDLGNSLFARQPVLPLIVDRLPVTVTLAFASLMLALFVAIPLGVVAALRPNSWLDRLALSLAVLGQAMPSFWFGLLLILVFGVQLQWLPISGSSSAAHFVLPAITLGYFAMPAIMRLTRAGMIDVLESDYIRTARAKGLRTGSVLFKHALRNAIVPVVALAAVQLGVLLGGSIIVETVFGLSGVGQLAYESIQRADFPVLQAVVLIVSLVYVLLTLLADLLNAWLDPRIRVA